MKGQDPTTPAEWQEAVDASAAWRMIADSEMYGLLQGGPSINVERCDELVERGRARGIQPSHPVEHLALGLIAAWNSGPDEDGRGKEQL